MVGRGGAKNVGSQSGLRKDGVRLGNANNRRTFMEGLNVSQTKSNHDVANQRVMSLNMINEQVGSGEDTNEALGNNSHHVQDDHLNTLSGHSVHESEGFVSPNDGIDAQLGKRKRMNKLAEKVNIVLGVQVVVDPPPVMDEDVIAQRISVQYQEPYGASTNTTISINSENGEATSKTKRKGDRGKYKSYVVDMKVKGKKSKLKISVPDEIDRAIGENEQQNGRIKPTADVIWLAEHTHKNDKGELEWADRGRSKDIYEKLKAVVATHGDSKTLEEILLEVSEPRSGYFRDKGIALRGFNKGRQLLEHQSIVREQ